MIQLAWRFLMFQKDSTLAQWFRARTESARGTRKTMIVALARKLLIALWRLVCQSALDWDPRSASKGGSDSILMMEEAPRQ
jgi:transposase